MKKKVLCRALLGMPLGICIGYLITILLSLGWGDGHYSPCVPALAAQLGSEIAAVVLQTALCALMGGVFAAASLIWEMDEWSLVRQTGTYFFISSMTLLPIAYISHWMEHTLEGILVYFSIFLILFVLIWLIQFAFWKLKIHSLQKKMGRKVRIK